MVLEDRTPIGCIEEIFGPGGCPGWALLALALVYRVQACPALERNCPHLSRHPRPPRWQPTKPNPTPPLAVMMPFYALRYAGQQPMPASLAPGATVYSVDRCARPVFRLFLGILTKVLALAAMAVTLAAVAVAIHLAWCCCVVPRAAPCWPLCHLSLVCRAGFVLPKALRPLFPSHNISIAHRGCISRPPVMQAGRLCASRGAAPLFSFAQNLSISHPAFCFSSPHLAGWRTLCCPRR